eukprot:COSAG02_NODE_2020_length_10087_cov_4.239688_5_plen_175_part_00
MACLQCCTPEQWCRERGSTNPQCEDTPASSVVPSPPPQEPARDSNDGGASDSVVAPHGPDRVLPVTVPPETAFRASDTNNDGYLSSDEVVTGLTVLNGGQAPNATFVSSLDTNGDNRIGWGEFKAAVLANDGGDTITASAEVETETLIPCEDNLDDCEGWGKFSSFGCCLQFIW